ncbi:unnamed protein product [Euphydryas editha]|uniref:Uncharacterized protein n=1 Tax=Euphydryas editha TaxID=104508 RepID=A0AAU9V0G5_EUPED|nr:unnamed protein product [Euphydryas editha]
MRQIDIISPKLFNVALQDALKLLEWRVFGINTNSEIITFDLPTISCLWQNPWKTSALYLVTSMGVSQRVDLTMNMDKRKIMLANVASSDSCPQDGQTT